MRALEFTKRNVKEILRDPLSWVFMIFLPVLLFVVLEIMVDAIGADISYTPQFEVKRLTVSMIIFAFSFITIFTGNTLAKDREDRFLMRLKAAPMRPFDFVFGYTVAVLPFAALQEIVVVLTGLCFGLEVSGSLLIMMAAMLPVSLIFIGFGVLFGSLISSKGVGGIASIIPTAASLTGGMFFPLETMEGGFKNMCDALPFANAIGIGGALIGGDASGVTASAVIGIGYVAAIYILAVAIFSIKLRGDSI